MRSLFNLRTALLAVTMTVMLLPIPAAAMASGQVVEKAHPEDQSHHEDRAVKKQECRDCHKCPRPTRQDPCLISCPRYESHFFSQQRVEESPEMIIIDQLSELYGAVVFAHQMHAEMAEMGGGCETCHHYSEQTGEIPPCRECHDQEHHKVDLSRPALKGAYHRQCMNCHLDWSHENACGFCHEQAVEVLSTATPDTTDIVGIPHPIIEAVPTYTYDTPYEEGPIVTFHHTDHVDMFGQNCVDCHRGDSCGRCHDAEREKQTSLNHVTSCCSCHGKRDCRFCHKDEAMPNFEHGASTGWSLSEYHEEKDCTSCHGKPDSFRTPQTECVSCHIHWEDGAFNHAITGLTLDEDHIDNDCADCHVKLEFTIDPTCDNCHDEPMLPERMPGRLELHR